MTADPYVANDALSDPQSWNRYAYVGNDPINFVDPSGTNRADPDRAHCCRLGLPGWVFGVYYDAEEGGIGSYVTNSWGTDVGGGDDFDDTGGDGPASATTSVRASLVRLRSALDPDCLGFLESGIAGGNLKTFNQYFNQLPRFAAGASDFSGTKYANLNAATGASDLPYVLTVNSTGAFFNNSRGVGYADKYEKEVENLQPATKAAQYFILLHELGHYFQADSFIQDDAKNLGAQRKNNDLLWEKCNKTIRPGA